MNNKDVLTADIVAATASSIDVINVMEKI